MDDLAVPQTRGTNTELSFVQNVHTELAKADIAIDWAARMGNIQLLEEWVDEKIRLQRQFVEWWDKSVGVNRGAGRGNKKNADPHSFSVNDAETHTGVQQYQVSRWRTTSVKDPDKCRERQIIAALRKAGIEPPENHRAEGTGDNEWYTPARYVEIARSVMGGIDLDPASNEVAQAWIKAKKYFTVTDNGLKRQWQGRIWLNPPYAQPAIGHFVDKLVAERSARRVDQAILLTHNYTDTAWFHSALGGADMVCLTRGRIKFVDADGAECAPTQGQAFFYYGSHREAFATAFAPVGAVLSVSC